MEFVNLLQSDSSSGDSEAKSSRPNQSQQKSKRKRQTFVTPSRLQEAFPDIPSDALCQLSEIEALTPTDVLTLIPAATYTQIAQYSY